MISIICSSQEPKNDFKDHILKTCGLPNAEFIFYENKGKYSLTELYNKGLDESKFNIVVFLHHDIDVLNNNWGSKLLKHYERNKEFGILGVAGSKELPKSGQWWENRNKMYGQVSHSHNGKTWLSKYSDSLGNKLNETVIVDGVFFSINKERIKERFDENVSGFHFYDIDFCFNNFIKGVKIGVHYDIKILHHSIGQTNDEWEKNRILFSEKFKDNLPVTLNREFIKNEKIITIFGCRTISEKLETLELVNLMNKNGCNVTVSSQITDDLITKSRGWKFNISNITEPPNYKRGDGEWVIPTQNGPVKSEDGKLYKISDGRIDVLISNETDIIDYFSKLYPNISLIQPIYNINDVLSFNPIVKKYMVRNEELKTSIMRSYDMSGDNIVLVETPNDIIELIKSVV